MSFFSSGNKSSEIKPIDSDCVSDEELKKFELKNQLVELALPLAQTWKDNHPNAQPGSEADLDSCVLAVAIEMTVAGEVVGGPMGALISSECGVTAASIACRRILQ